MLQNYLEDLLKQIVVSPHFYICFSRSGGVGQKSVSLVILRYAVAAGLENSVRNSVLKYTFHYLLSAIITTLIHTPPKIINVTYYVIKMPILSLLIIATLSMHCVPVLLILQGRYYCPFLPIKA